MMHLNGLQGCGQISEWNDPIALIQFHIKEVDKNKTTTFCYTLFGINYEYF